MGETLMKKIFIILLGLIITFPTFAITSVKTDTSDVLDGFFYEADTEINHEDFQQDEYWQELEVLAAQKVKEMLNSFSIEDIQKHLEKCSDE